MFKPLAATALLALLAACATPAPAPPTVAAANATPAPDADASAYGLFLAGTAARDEGHLGAAATYYGRAATAEGDPGYLKTDAFHAALESGDVAGALAVAPQAGGDAAPADLRLAALTRGVAAMVAGDDRGAYAIFTGADIGFPYRSVALLIAPYAALGAGDTAHALARPALAGDAVGQFVGDLDLALLQERLGHAQDAEAGYKTLMAQGDAAGVVSESYAAFLERRGRWKDAVALLTDAAARDPDDPDMAAALSRAQKHARPPSLGTPRQGAAEALIIPAAGLVAQKQGDSALDVLRLALALDPGNDEAWLLVGDVLAPADVDAARTAYAHVAASSPNYVGAQTKLAWTYETSGDHAAALKIARLLAASNPDSHEAGVALADLLRDDSQYSESATVLTGLIGTGGPATDWRLYFIRASDFDDSDQPDKVQADLTAALKLAPDEPELLNFQAYFWIDRGENLKEALAMVQRAADAEPDSGAITDSLGWAYYKLGDYKTAVEKLSQAVLLAPSIPEVNDHLGDAYWRVGRKTEATFEWRRALSLGPDDKLKARDEEKLASPLGPDAPAGSPVAPTATP
jgi:tetratricopeptide (TPR) repeat protein